jgi:two-component system NarL family response regulator
MGLSVMGTASSGEEALLLVKGCPVEVVLLDLRMPGISGIETLRELRKLPCPPKTIVLSSFEPDEEILRAVDSGAKGYLCKDTSTNEIIQAIHAVHSGGTYLPGWIVARMSQRRLRSSLSPRELEILEMVAKGLTNKEIGRVIQVSPFTVRNHVRHIMVKLEVGDRTEAATVAIREGILTHYDSSHSGGYPADTPIAPQMARLRFDVGAGVKPAGIVRNSTGNWATFPRVAGAQ